MRWTILRDGGQALRVCLRVALLGALAVAARPAAAADPLRLCVDPDNLPFSSARPDAPPGLYIDLGRAIAAALGRPAEPVWSLTYWGKRNLRETMLAGQCDIAVGLPDDHDFMGPKVIFSRPIMEIGYALLVPKDMAVLHLADLAGKRVAAQFASPPQGLLATHDEIATVTVLSPEEAIQKLAGHAADAAFIWGPSAGYLNHAVLGDAYRVIPVAGQGMRFQAAIGFARNQAALRDAVNAVLDKVLADLPAMAAKYAFPTGAPITLAAAGAAEPAYVLAASDAGAVADGRELFNGTCAHCHGPDAIQSERRINLRLLKHRYGDTMDDVFHLTVTKGRPSKGMPSWAGVFSDEDFTKILAYLKSVQQD